MPQPPKAYRNLDFLTSEAARYIRILCEYEEPKQRFKDLQIERTIVFFGSARIQDQAAAEVNLTYAKDQLELHPDDTDLKRLVSKALTGVRMSFYYEAARELAKRLTAWSLERPIHEQYYICSGAGPGIMEAANRGASEVAGGRSIGLGISLPLEQGNNEWVTPELAFEFHYFFTRKYWFLFPCQALVIFPGGFGTLDELFETLTLVQTRKIAHDLPIVLFGPEYWEKVINLQAMTEFGTIGIEDLSLIHITDSVDEAFQYLTNRLHPA